ncbi:MAG: DinB family protein [Vicinamibacterales bacterium]
MNDPMMREFPDVLALDVAFLEIERDARAIVDGVREAEGTWRAAPASWTVAECLDHLAVGNRVYLDAMRPAAARARTRGRLRRGPARPGLVGGWFVRWLEPPVTRRRTIAAPAKIRPRLGPTLASAAQDFIASHDAVRGFLREYAHLDLASVRFPNPFIRGVRFSLATGLHVIAAHERRHLWQARNVATDAASALAAELSRGMCSALEGRIQVWRRGMGAPHKH